MFGEWSAVVTNTPPLTQSMQFSLLIMDDYRLRGEILRKVRKKISGILVKR